MKKFSKKTLFAASLFAASALTVPAAESTLTIDRNHTENIVLGNEESLTITVNKDSSHTLFGSIQTSDGALADKIEIPADGTPSEKWNGVFDSGEFTQYYQNGTGEDEDAIAKITLTGGGSLTYKPNMLGSGYYSSTYQTNRGLSDVPAAIIASWKSVESLWNQNAFRGTLEVTGNTTFYLVGQISQYVAFYRPTPGNSPREGSPRVSGYAGVSDVVLDAGSTISFEHSAANLASNAPNLYATDPNADYDDPGMTKSLNFLNNLHADANSTLVIGTDAGSTNRIVLHVDGKEEEGGSAGSTVGTLKGNGRLYTAGTGSIAFIGESKLDSGSNNDTSGNLYREGNRLTDVVLGNSYVSVGTDTVQLNGEGMTDSAAVAVAVDNVFANATAVHIGYMANYTDTSGKSNASSTTYTVNQRGDRVDNAEIGLVAPKVTVFGNQIFNNFQSLWAERSELMSNPSLGDPVTLADEPMMFHYKPSTGTVYYSTGSDSSVRVAGNSVLTIDQDYGRDGWYKGTLRTTATDVEAEDDYPDCREGLVVKTGDGTFLYDNAGGNTEGLTQLRVEGGSWIGRPDGMKNTRVTLAKTGSLELIIDGTGSTSMLVRAIDPTTTLELERSASIRNGLTEDALADIAADPNRELTDSDFRTHTLTTDLTRSASIQFLREQPQFCGSISVEDGTWLHLGNAASSGSIFSSAAGINLNGEGSGFLADHLKYSYLFINGNQLVNNLSGESGKAAIVVHAGGTLSLNNSEDTYHGVFKGAGNFVKLGAASLTLVSGDTREDGYGYLRGAVTALAGTLDIVQTLADEDGFSGLVLANGAVASISGASNKATVGALVGDAGTSLSVSGDLVVGRNLAEVQSTVAGEYFATAKYGDYAEYFSGTSVESVRTALENNVNSVRNGQVTTDDTVSYIKDPGRFDSDFSGNIANGSLKKLYATTGTLRDGVDVFANMKNSANGGNVFGSAANVKDWLVNTFTQENIADYIGKDSQLTDYMKETLTDLARRISSSGVDAYLDKDGNLNVEGWNKIVAAGGLEYLKYLAAGEGATAPSGLETYVDAHDESLYTFITYFTGEDNYSFILTESNADKIADDYGLNSAGWITTSGANYENFKKALGVVENAEDLAYAGTISGTGNLRKSGAETLRLTGRNTYSGTTAVDGGELRVDWDAIRRTGGISVAAGALLTIDADDGEITKIKDIKDEIAAGTRDDDDSVQNGYGVFSAIDTMRLSGNGVVLKLGDGKLDLANAVYDVPEGGEDFTGTFLVGEGTLRAKINATARENIAFNIDFSENNSDKRFELVFENRNAAGARTVVFDGTIGHAKDSAPVTKSVFSLDAGRFVPVTNGNPVNNVLQVAADKIFAEKVELVSGTLRLAAAAGTTDVKIGEVSFNNVNITATPTLAFALESGANISLENANFSKTSTDDTSSNQLQKRNNYNANFSKTSTDDTARGKLVVSTEWNDGTELFNTGTLSLENVEMSGISSIEIAGGATLKMSGNLTDTGTGSENYTVELEHLSTAAGTTLDLNKTYKLELTNSATLAGTLTGDGTLEFSGEKLTLGSEDAKDGEAFSGEIVFKSGEIELVAGADKTVSYKGLKISDGENTADRVLSKTGAGTVEISANAEKTNKIDVADLSVRVDAGTLKIGGALFVNNGEMTLPTSIAIADKAKFTFDAFDQLATDETFSLDEINVSGKGTLGFETSGAGAAEISVESNIFTTADGNPTFTGTVSVGKNVTLNLGAEVTEFSGIAGAGTVNVANDKLTVRVDGNSDGVEKFTGTFTGNLSELDVVGNGTMNFETVPSGVNTISVGSATENGGVGVAEDWNGAVTAVGADVRVALNGEKQDAFSGTITVAESVENLTLLRSGTLDFAGEGTISSAFNLENSAGGKIALDGNAGFAATLGNVGGTTLTLTNFHSHADEVFALRTNGGENGGIVFSGNSGATTFAAVEEIPAETDDTIVWTKDISGDGFVSVENGAKLRLEAANLSFSGETSVGVDSELTYASAGTISQSSRLDVKGTLKGGVALVGAGEGGNGTNVVFARDSQFVFTGEAVKFTGTAEFDGKGDSDAELSVKLDKALLGRRGEKLALFEYIGSGSAAGKNGISIDDINFSSEDGVKFYRGAPHEFSFDATYETGKTEIYAATDNLAGIGVSLHDGLNAKFVEKLSAIATPKDGWLDDSADAPVYYTYGEKGEHGEKGERTGLTALGRLADAIIKTPNGELSDALNNLSPLSFSAMLALPQSGFIGDIAAVSARMEQRRYDNFSQFIWETSNDWESFVQVQGAFADSDNGSDTRTYDINSYGAIAGMDVKLDATAVAGFALAYDYGKAKIHGNGGDIDSHDIRLTAFFGKVFAEQCYLNTGAQFGFAMFETDRKTLGGNVEGDATGWHGGVFAEVGTLLPLYLSEDETTGVYLMPHFGLDCSYYGVGSFDEDGGAASTKTDAFGAASLRASIGATLAVKTEMFGHNSRIDVDIAYTRELLDTETDIDTEYTELKTGKMSFEAATFAQDVFSVGPRFVYDLDDNKSVFAGYRFDLSTDSDTVHSVNVGFRSRF